MKLLLSKKQRQCGLVWLLIFFAVPAILLFAYFLWRVFTWHPHYDHTHGNGDPETNAALAHMAGQQWLEAQIASNTNSAFFIPELGVSGILDPLTHANPREIVRSSTNLVDWRIEENLGWLEACDEVSTNHTLPMKFYQRAIVW